jgi:Fe-S-cluster containining protein
MTRIYTTKNKIFSQLFNVYNLTDEFSNSCPSGCSLCEHKESLMFLPFEEEYILKETGEDQSNMYLKNQYGHCYQPFGFSCSMLNSIGTCKIYNVRPFDCRSFPIIPLFNLGEANNAIDFYLASSYCPIVKNLPENFINTTIECWKSIAENLPDDWKMEYNKLNKHNYSNQILDI